MHIVYLIPVCRNRRHNFLAHRCATLLHFAALTESRRSGCPYGAHPRRSGVSSVSHTNGSRRYHRGSSRVQQHLRSRGRTYQPSPVRVTVPQFVGC